MADEPRYRTIVETPECAAQFDAIVAKHSIDVIAPPLEGLLWGIATNPQAYNRVKPAIYQARSRSFGLTIPVLTILFQIQNKGEENEQILLLWIEERNAMDEIFEP